MVFMKIYEVYLFYAVMYNLFKTFMDKKKIDNSPANPKMF